MKSYLRRAVLATLGATALFGPSVFSGCAVNFSPPGKLNTLRVISVTADKPYAPPIDHDACIADPTKCTVPVTFTMDLYDGLGLLNDGKERQINVLWIGGCFNPEGDQYSLCLFPLLQLFEQARPALEEAQSGGIPEFPAGLPVALSMYPNPEQHPTFTVQVPDIVSSRPKPDFGPHYGIGYVFFLACAGDFGLLDADPSAAGNFPIGCFDPESGEVLGADSFVPGYTQIYSFADGRENNNPPLKGITLDEETISEDEAQPTRVKLCDVPPDERNKPPSCTREDPLLACTTYDISVDVPDDVGEIDPEAKGDEGQQLTETVWVNFYSDTGDFVGDIKLVNDPTTGFQKEHKVEWLPPAEPGPTRIWAVVRDARGGSTVMMRELLVE